MERSEKEISLAKKRFIASAVQAGCFAALTAILAIAYFKSKEAE
jgi:Zn ribbon nucleic-acid-binding protein